MPAGRQRSSNWAASWDGILYQYGAVGRVGSGSAIPDPAQSNTSNESNKRLSRTPSALLANSAAYITRSHHAPRSRDLAPVRRLDGKKRKPNQSCTHTLYL
ncbi:hypothetical protein SAMD00023353_5200570 [Rosellinia necatrix]|uniref:Uncharacterized protein n=1 Tax=Rosellinia necatrix TaxID=77044 RepID=A0A1S8A9P7_ROSNE|nr:hypothetical protein SAMD00023353_5200570 [Rosellinia necatrix]